MPDGRGQLERLAKGDKRWRYALDVVDERIPAGELLRKAAARFISDLDRTDLVFDSAQAAKVVRKFDGLPLPGVQARDRWRMLPWQHWCTVQLYGFRWPDGGGRRFETVSLVTARGSGKSIWAAAVCFLELVSRPRQHGVILAETFDQTLGPFRYLHELAESTPLNNPVRVVGGGDKPSEIVSGSGPTASRLVRMANQREGRGRSGFTPSLVWVEELQEVASEATIERVLSGLKDRREPLVLYMSNPGAGVNIPAWSEMERAKAALEEGGDDSYLSLLYMTDGGDDVRADESSWVKANPSLPAAPGVAYLRKRVRAAHGSPSRWAEVERLNLGRWTMATAPAIPMHEFLDAEVEELSPLEERAKRPCILALDLSRTRDLTALAAVWDMPDGRLELEVRAYTPEETLKARQTTDGAPYTDWVGLGDLITTSPGKLIRLERVLADVQDYLRLHDVRLLAYDKYDIDRFAALLERHGIAYHKRGRVQRPERGLWLLPHPMGHLDGPREGDNWNRKLKAWMPASFSAFKDALTLRTISIKRNACLRAGAFMVEAKTDVRGNDIPDAAAAREKRAKIDPLIVSVMAVGVLSRWKTLRRR